MRVFELFCADNALAECFFLHSFRCVFAGASVPVGSSTWSHSGRICVLELRRFICRTSPPLMVDTSAFSSLPRAFTTRERDLLVGQGRSHCDLSSGDLQLRPSQTLSASLSISKSDVHSSFFLLSESHVSLFSFLLYCACCLVFGASARLSLFLASTSFLAKLLMLTRFSFLSVPGTAAGQSTPTRLHSKP